MQLRQGDILVERVEGLPAGVDAHTMRQVDGPLVLAEGEATGHAHRLVTEGRTSLVAAERLEADPTVGWLTVEAQARLIHDEHAPLDLPPGTYRVVQQRRYDPRQDRALYASD